MAAETVGDYVAGFLGMAEGNAWSMNAFDVCSVLYGSACQTRALTTRAVYP